MDKLSEEYRAFVSQWEGKFAPAIENIISAVNGVGALPCGMEFTNEPPTIEKDRYTKKPILRIPYTYSCYSEHSRSDFVIPLEVLDETDHEKIRETFKASCDEYEKNLKRELEEQQKRFREQAEEAKARREKAKTLQEKAHLVELINKYGIPKEFENGEYED